MIRLLTVCLVTAAIRAQQATGNYQIPPSTGDATPFYNLLASSLLSKCPGLNSTTGNPAPLSCTCGFCNQRALNAPGPPQPASVLSGVVVFPSSEFQHALQAPVPLYAPSPHSHPNPPPPTVYPPPQLHTPYPPPIQQPNSYIMSIPRKYSQEAPPPKPIQETFLSSQNPVYTLPSPPPTSSPPRPFYYTPKPPLMASCPATFYFPSTQAMSFNQPTVYSPPPSSPPSPPSYPPPPNTQPPNFGKPYPPVAGPPQPPSLPPGSSKEPLITYNLRGTTNNDVLPATSLEAESKDCSVPIPPVLV